MQKVNGIFVLLVTILFCSSFSVSGQENDKDLVQFSGVIVATDSMQPVPFANIIIASTSRGTVSDYYGYFSFVAKRLDTIVFTSVGYKRDTFLIPDTITGQWYSLIQVMKRDTVLLKEAIIYPWPTKEQFRQAFLNLDIPDDDLEIARKNLDPRELAKRGENMRMSSSMNYRNFIDQQTSKLYYNGQTQPLSILNPFAWAKFIKAWRDGKFKREKDDD
jgi:carboxypeptidase-like protein